MKELQNQVLLSWKVRSSGRASIYRGRMVESSERKWPLDGNGPSVMVYRYVEGVIGDSSQ